MGFLAETFGYGDDMPKRPPVPQFDPRAEEFQGQLYPAITSGLQGKGLTPEVNARSLRDTLASLKDSYLDFQGQLPGFIARNIQREDVGVQDFLRQSSEAEYGRQWEGAQNDFAMQNFADIDAATQAAFGALGSEKKLAGGITSAYNESMYRREFAPDFDTGLMSGAGGAAGTVMGSWKSKTQEQTPYEYYGSNNNSYGDPNATRRILGSSSPSNYQGSSNFSSYNDPGQLYAQRFGETNY